MYLVISLLVLRAGYGIWLYQFLTIAYLFTLDNQKCSQDDVVNNFVANDAHTGLTKIGGHRTDINSQGIDMQPEQECQIEYVW